MQKLTFTGLSPYVVQLSRSFNFTFTIILQSYNPDNAETLSVWALPVSLATTQGIIIIFFSSAYLDVSVQRVIHRSDKSDGFPHSEIFGSKLISSSPKLIAASHVLHRL